MLHVALLGAMGSGKSTIGRPLAVALDRPFVDNDAQLFERTGTTAAELAAREGVEALHDEEAQGLLRALHSSEPSVIAAAASTINDPEVRESLPRDAFVVWLRADPETLAARMPQLKTRPFADEEPAQVVSRQAERRDPLYAQVADLTVETDRTSPAATVARILGKLPAALKATQ
jgi:shikimate kinase